MAKRRKKDAISEDDYRQIKRVEALRNARSRIAEETGYADHLIRVDYVEGDVFDVDGYVFVVEIRSPTPSSRNIVMVVDPELAVAVGTALNDWRAGKLDAALEDGEW